jgi:tRNA pseudouridine38-40 synthase
MLQRYKCVVHYLGHHFHGWETNRGVATVQGVLESVIGNSGLCKAHQPGTRFAVQGAGRTDRGVHAVGQVCHFDLGWSEAGGRGPLTGAAVRRAVNFHLQREHHGDCVRVVQANRVDSGFHSRFCAVQREYRYRIWTTRDRFSMPVFEKHLAWHVQAELDVPRMQQAAQLFVGSNNMASFRSSRCERSPLVTVGGCEVREWAAEDARVPWSSSQGAKLVEVRVWAPSFLYNQVRTMVAALVDVGSGKREPAFITECIAAEDRASNPTRTAPPQGLYFHEVAFGHTPFGEYTEYPVDE